MDYRRIPFGDRRSGDCGDTRRLTVALRSFDDAASPGGGIASRGVSSF
jgi:hypothetical protein